MNSNKFPPLTDSKKKKNGVHRSRFTITEYLDFFLRFYKRRHKNRRKLIAETNADLAEIRKNRPLSPLERRKKNVVILMIICSLLIIATLTVFAVFSALQSVPTGVGDGGTTTGGDDGTYRETLTMVDGSNVSRVPSLNADGIKFGNSESLVNIDPDKLLSEYAILVDLSSNEAVAALSPDERIFPASMTKVMTLIIACENVKSLTERITFSEEVIAYTKSIGASSFGFDAGDEVTVEALLYAISLKSCAQATIVISEKVAGSTYAFVERMNAKAAELGLVGTHFANPIGMDDELNYTTPREMAAMMKYALSNELCRKLLCEDYYETTAHYYKESGEYASVKYSFYSTLFRDRLNGEAVLPSGTTILGGKTGYETKAKYCLVTYAVSPGGKEYILVTAFAPKSSDENSSVTDLKYIYSQYAK